MAWWALVPVVTLLSGPLTLLALKRAKREARRREEQAVEAAEVAYQRLLAEDEARRDELPGSGGRGPGTRA